MSLPIWSYSTTKCHRTVHAVVRHVNHNSKETADFQVVQGESHTLLSLDTSQVFHLIKVVVHTSSVTGEQSKSNEGVESCKGSNHN